MAVKMEEEEEVMISFLFPPCAVEMSGLRSWCLHSAGNSARLAGAARTGTGLALAQRATFEVQIRVGEVGCCCNGSHSDAPLGFPPSLYVIRSTSRCPSTPRHLDSSARNSSARHFTT